MRSLVGPIVKSLVFVVITTTATALLALTITNGRVGGGHTFTALFTDATSLQSGDDVRMAGVRIGQVSSVSLDAPPHGSSAPVLARVRFTVQSDVALARTITVAIRYRNLIGQRYLALDEGTGSLRSPLPPGSTIPVSATTPALDLTELFNGFQPLFQALQPTEINELSAEIIAVFQGEGPTVDDLLSQTASLTQTLADKDDVIGEVVDNLDSVLETVVAHRSQVTTTISTLATLVKGLAADRGAIGSAISGIGSLAGSVAGLLSQARAPLAKSITALEPLAANLAANNASLLNSFLATLPSKLTSIGRLASYGSWLNFYLCSVSGRIPLPGEDPSTAPETFTGTAGATPETARCS